MRNEFCIIEKVNGFSITAPIEDTNTFGKRWTCKIFKGDVFVAEKEGETENLAKVAARNFIKDIVKW